MIAPAQRPPHLATMILLVALVVLTLNMFLPALPRMAEVFGVSEATMGLAVSAYMVAAGVMQLILGPISDLLGRRRVILVALAVYVLASLGAALAVDFTLFLICRLLQALVLAGSVVGLAALRDMYSTREAAGKMGTIAAAMAIAPMIGPTVGGILDTLVGWRAIFGFYTLLGAICLVLAWIDWGETRVRVRRSPREQIAAYRALLGSGLYWAYALCTGVSVGTFYIFLTGAPFVALESFGLSTTWIGVGLGSITGGYMLGSVITARLAPRLGVTVLILVGRGFALAGLCAGAGVFLLGFWHPLVLFGATICVGFGNGLTISNTNAGLISVRPDLAGSAAGLSGALQLFGGAVLTGLTLPVMAAGATPLRLLALMIAASVIALGLAVLAARGAARQPVD
ncbi:MFS transporter [Roseicyclus marinus]|uniref:MFS transporter n=1 Tax=Roseicyclus marinus TaxID=2161673 RepID=UPI00240EFFA4|nr:MFS transporter [Roseicyclus marinus]MDG3042501.1 MFS transporter [Roseicyclus marinus]